MQNVQSVYDEIAEEWNKYKSNPLPAMNLLIDYGTNGSGHERCLDAGTGNGRHLPLLAKKYETVYAIDNSQKLLSIAAKNAELNQLTNVHFDLADITLLPFETGIFDDVYCIAVLHHLASDKILVAFKEISRVLKPGGLLIASVWNKHESKFSNLQNEDYVPWKMQNGKTVKRFVHFFESEEIRQYAEQSGLEIVDLFFESRGQKVSGVVEKNTAQNLCFILKKA